MSKNKKEYPCPECSYPMDEVLIKKGGVHKRRIVRLECGACGHSELKRSMSERFRDGDI